MKWLGYDQIPLESIQCDIAEIERRSKAEHVVALASDIRARGDEPIQAPTIRSKDNRLICGRDRLAAMTLLKSDRAWVHLVDCTDNEAKELELAENIYRRAENRAELLAELVKIKKDHLRAQNESADANTIGNSVADRAVASKLSDKQIKAQARKEVAQAAGVKPAAVKRAEERVAAKVRAPETETDRLLPEGFNDLDLRIDDSAAKKISSLAGQLRKWESDTRMILTELTRVETERSMSGRHIDRIRDAVKGAGQAIGDAIPASLCLSCKGKPTDCDACNHVGWLGRGDSAPPEPPSKKKRGVTVVIENTDGSETPVTDDMVAAE